MDGVHDWPMAKWSQAVGNTDSRLSRKISIEKEECTRKHILFSFLALFLEEIAINSNRSNI